MRIARPVLAVTLLVAAGVTAGPVAAQDRVAQYLGLSKATLEQPITPAELLEGRSQLTVTGRPGSVGAGEAATASGIVTTIRSIALAAREADLLQMEPLEAVDQHWAVRFLEDVLTHVDDVVRCDADQVGIEGPMVQ